MQLELPLAGPHPGPPAVPPAAPQPRHALPPTDRRAGLPPAVGTSAVPPRVAEGVSHAAPTTAVSDAVVLMRHPTARRYVLRVQDDGTVRVTIPRGGSARAAREFAQEHRFWIDKERRQIALKHAERPPSESPEAVRDLRARAARELPPRLLELAARHGLDVRRISIRNQRSRWGSCSRNAHICLNWRLLQMPAFVRDYVMVHELMHLKRMDHSPRFWKLVAAACHDYKAARAWLRAFGRR